MGESYDDRIARRKRERAEFLKRQREQDEALLDAINKDPQLADYLDWDFERGIKQTTGISMSDLAKVQPGEGVTERDIDEAMRVIAEAKKAAEGGFLRAKNPKKAKKLLENSKAVKKVGKKAKKDTDRSCFIAALVILAGSGATTIGITWAAVDLVSRMFS